MSPLAIWIAAAALLLAFLAWYLPWRGPLSPDEVERYVERMQARSASESEVAELRRFLEQDDGRDFVMVNAILLREKPLVVGDVQPGESSGRTLRRYMAYMWPALLRRACHPVVVGPAVASSLDVWGIEDAERWSQAGLMRYRSRRDLMEIATDPRFAPAHQYKEAAMEKTLAFPIRPVVFGGVPWLVGLLVAALASVAHLVFGRG